MEHHTLREAKTTHSKPDAPIFYRGLHPNVLQNEPQSEDFSTSRIPRKIVFDELLNTPQIVTSVSTPRNLFSRFLSIFGN